MKLNLPIVDLLEASENILIAGAGGGFDVYAGLPIYFALLEMGKYVHLANLTFADFTIGEHVAEKHEILIEKKLMSVSGSIQVPLNYFPEVYLSQWFKEVRGEDVPVWMLPNEGAVPLKEAYKKLVEHLKIDAIVLVDGGVDSLMRGDEAGPGTLIADTLSLIAVDHVDVPLKILAAIGFGTEVEEALCHYSALENIAALAKAGGFLGSCALTPQMEVFKMYEQACRYVWELPDGAKSHISTRIIPAVHGEFGNYLMYKEPRFNAVFHSPLMSLYWFFTIEHVIQSSILARHIEDTNSKLEAVNVMARFVRSGGLTRPRKSLPY